MGRPTRLKLEGGDELRRLLKQAGGKEMTKELGKVHKQIGQMVIARVGGPVSGVGSGAGSRLRPSAASREVIIRVGGKHRERRVQQWGKTAVRPHPQRPNIIGAAEEIENRINNTYIEGVENLLRPLSR